MMSVGNNIFNPDERDRQIKLIRVMRKIVVKFVDDEYTVKMDKCNVKNIHKLNKLLKEDTDCKKCKQSNHNHNGGCNGNDDSSSSDEDE
jgi:hypothetical protein